MSASGGIFHDHQGSVLAAFKTFLGHHPILFLELMDVCEGWVFLLWRWNWTPLWWFIGLHLSTRSDGISLTVLPGSKPFPFHSQSTFVMSSERQLLQLILWPIGPAPIKHSNGSHILEISLHDWQVLFSSILRRTLTLGDDYISNFHFDILSLY